MSDRRSSFILALAGATLLAGCTERYEGGAACPALCPEQSLPIREIVLDAISFDATIPGFPPRGTGGFLMLAASGDEVETRIVIRFDSLPQTYPTVGGPEPITAVSGAHLQLHVDTSLSSLLGPATLELYSVDAGGADTSDAVVAAMFLPDRLIGVTEFSGESAFPDTVDIQIQDQFVLERILAEGGRMRFGIRLVSETPARLSIFSANTSQFGRLIFHPAPGDSAVLPLVVFPRSRTPDDRHIALDYTDYVIPVKGAFPLAQSQGLEHTGLLVDSLFAVGGVEGRRSFIRFAIPDSLFDAASIVRATLILQQRPSANFGFADSVTIVPQVVVGSGRLPIARAAMIVDTLGFFPIPSIRVSPADTGERRIELINAMTPWRAVRGEFTMHAVTLRAGAEGRTPVEALFHSIEAPAALRPKLRISYIPRLEFGIP